MELRAEGVTKRFGPRTALADVSLTLDSGAHVAVHGPNGSGKTTLLRVLAGLSRPNEGRVALDGSDVYAREMDSTGAIGYLGHASMLYEDLTARENLAFHATLWGLPERRIDEVLDLVGLADRERGYPREFSHGMTKRLSLARAILPDPPILLLDEPFTGLDSQSRETLVSLFEDRTVLLVTHDPAPSLDHCDRVVVLDGGRRVGAFETASMTVDAFKDAYRQVCST